MTFRDKIELTVKGKPIEKQYLISTTEKSFKEKANSRLTDEGLSNPFSFSKKFEGRFQGMYGREFQLKPKSSFFNKDSLSNSIWIQGKLEPVDKDQVICQVVFNRTNFSRLGQWIVSGVIGFLIVFIGFQSLKVGDFKNFLIFEFSLVFIYFVAIMISSSQTSGQIRYFEKHFFQDFEKLEIEKEKNTVSTAKNKRKPA